ncbi:MAG: hypothetical protein KatS3mg089_1017 [Patescibacteria group bacterium]|nr:MAG: hypothetical protein KatS3mg089_1017 [Patescibacteria group bacterium]
MADITVPESAVASDKSKTSKKQAPSEPESTLKFRLNEFRSIESPGNALDKAKRERGEFEAQWVTIKERTLNQYKTYLANYMKNLQEFSEGPGKEILNQPGHEHEKLLLQILGGEDPAERERKISAFLESPEGWMLATLVMEHQSALKLYALGLYAATEAKNPEPTVPEEEKIFTGDGKMEKVREFWINKIRPQFKKADLREMLFRGVGVGILTYLQSGNPIWGVGSATAIIGAEAGAKGLIDAFRRGEVIDLKRSKDALLAMKSDPNTVLYMRKMYGIDLDDFQVTQAGDIQLRAGILASTRMDELQKEAVQGLYTRWSFYENLGIPRSKIDILPEQFIFKYAQGETPEQTDVRMQQRLREIVNPQNMNPQDVQDNLRRLNRARSQVMTEMIRDYIKRQDTPLDYAGPITSLRSKKDAYEGSTIKEQKTKAEREEIAELEKEREEIRSERERFTIVDQKRQELQDIERKLRDLGVSSLPDNPTIDEVEQVIDVEINSLEINLDPNNPSSPVAQKEDVLANKMNFINTTIGQLLTQGGRPQFSRQNAILELVEERAKNLYDQQIAELTEEINKIKEKIERLKSIKEEYRQKRKELMDEERKAIVYASKELNEIYAEYAFIINTQNATITDADLAALSLDQLKAKLKAPPYSARTQNLSDEELHEIIYRAKAKKKGEELESNYPSNSQQLRAYEEITQPGRPLSANDLLTKSDTELITILNNSYTGVFSNPSFPQGPQGPDMRQILALAKEEARRKMLLWYEAKLDARIEDIDRRINVLNKTIEGVDGFEQEKAVINTALDLLDRQSVLFTAVRELGALDEKSEKYFDISRIRADDPTYSQAERNLKTANNQQIEKGYYAIMDLLFDYQQRSDREEYFKIISSVLPPDKLAQLLNEHFHLRRSRNPTLRVILTELSARINNGTLDWRDLRQGVIFITDKLTHEALSLP